MGKQTTQLGRLLIAAVFAASFLLAFSTTYAKEPLPSGAFIVRPAKIELSINPGEEKTSILKLSNGTALPLSVVISYEDIAPSMQTSPSDDPVVLLGKNGGAYPIKELFHTRDTTVEILSASEIDVPIVVRVPKDAEGGGRYGSVVLTFKPILTKGEAQNTNVAVESRLATLFYVRIVGSANEDGKLASFGVFNNAKTTFVPTKEEPLRFQVTYENLGAVHLNPYGRITLSPVLGSPTTVVVDPQAVLPGATRMREVDVFDGLSIGYYRAHLELNRGYKDIVDEMDVTFWVLPGSLGATLILLGLLCLTWLIRRSLQLSKHFIS